MIALAAPPLRAVMDATPTTHPQPPCRPPPTCRRASCRPTNGRGRRFNTRLPKIASALDAILSPTRANYQGEARSRCTAAFESFSQRGECMMEAESEFAEKYGDQFYKPRKLGRQWVTPQQPLEVLRALTSEVDRL